MGAPQGKRERGTRATYRGSWLAGRGPEEAGTRWPAAGGGPVPRRQRSGGDGDEWLGRGASVGLGGASGGVGLANAGLRHPVRSKVDLASRNGYSGWKNCGSCDTEALGFYL